jgi:hypothetical protein
VKASRGTLRVKVPQKRGSHGDNTVPTYTWAHPRAPRCPSPRPAVSALRRSALAALMKAAWRCTSPESPGDVSRPLSVSPTGTTHAAQVDKVVPWGAT